MADAQPKNPSDKTFLRRGIKQPSPLGTTTFIGLRALDPLWQYQILRYGAGTSLLQSLGLSILPAGAPAQTGFAPIDALQLSPYRLILLAMSATAAAKHAFWVGVTSEEEFGPGTATMVSAFNTAFNTVNSLLFTSTLASASLDSEANFPQWPLLAGSGLFVAGILAETGAEVQRSRWKKRPENKGKVYTGGLWGVVRHVNYTGYTLWRTGYALAAGGWIWAGITAAFFGFEFVSRGVPELEGYCSQRYGQQWEDYKRQVPYNLIPYIW